MYVQVSTRRNFSRTGQPDQKSFFFDTHIELVKFVANLSYFGLKNKSYEELQRLVDEGEMSNFSIKINSDEKLYSC